MSSERVSLVKQFGFESAHFLPRVPEGHKCRRMHGHSFRVEVEVTGPIDPEFGWLMDYGEISAVVKPVVAELDHRLLNDIPGLENPTSEVIAVWLWERLVPDLPQLSRVSVLETCTTRCDYRGSK